VRFTRRRERGLLTLIEADATVSEASRDAQVSRTTIYRRAHEDAAFAHRLDLARVRVTGPPLEDWTAAAAFLEYEHPSAGKARPDPREPSRRAERPRSIDPRTPAVRNVT